MFANDFIRPAVQLFDYTTSVVPDISQARLIHHLRRERLEFLTSITEICERTISTVKPIMAAFNTDISQLTGDRDRLQQIDSAEALPRNKKLSMEVMRTMHDLLSLTADSASELKYEPGNDDPEKIWEEPESLENSVKGLNQQILEIANTLLLKAEQIAADTTSSDESLSSEVYQLLNEIANAPKIIPGIRQPDLFSQLPTEAKKLDWSRAQVSLAEFADDSDSDTRHISGFQGLPVEIQLRKESVKFTKEILCETTKAIQGLKARINSLQQYIHSDALFPLREAISYIRSLYFIARTLMITNNMQSDQVIKEDVSTSMEELSTQLKELEVSYGAIMKSFKELRERYPENSARYDQLIEQNLTLEKNEALLNTTVQIGGIQSGFPTIQPTDLVYHPEKSGQLRSSDSFSIQDALSPPSTPIDQKYQKPKESQPTFGEGFFSDLFQNTGQPLIIRSEPLVLDGAGYMDGPVIIRGDQDTEESST